MLQSSFDAVRYFPEFPAGLRKWDQRFFHPDAHGVERPLAELWGSGQPPLALESVIGLSRLLRRRMLSAPLRFVWSDAHQLQAALGENDG